MEAFFNAYMNLKKKSSASVKKLLLSAANLGQILVAENNQKRALKSLSSHLENDYGKNSTIGIFRVTI